MQVVDLSGGCEEEDSLESIECFFPLGGGEVEINTHVTQPQIASSRCVAVFREYFKQVCAFRDPA